MRIPPVVKTLLLINLVAFIADSLLGGFLSHICGLYYIFSPNFQPYQIISYMFMHGGFSHIFFNMFALWMFGRIMEEYWGGKRFLIYYLVCGVGAGLVQEIGQLVGLINPYANTIGASGAVYGILLAFGMTFPNEKLFIIPIPFPIKAKYFVMLYAVIEILEGFGASDGVAHFAHLGGMLFGLLLILYWKGKFRKTHFAGDSFWTASTTYDSYEGTYDKGEGGIFDNLKNIFGGSKSNNSRKKPKMTVTYGSSEREKDYEYNSEKKVDSEEIDRILDKVRKNGYANLTTEEKNKLFEASKK